ncbi:MAG: TonB-dependent receptor [Lysobacter sp.]|nr:TonB-dependent receptor [Lysobacter sp.]
MGAASERAAVVLLAACACAAHAQPPAPATLPGVIVTAARASQGTPAAVDRIDADAVPARSGRSVSELLRRVPGVVAHDRQNLAQDLQLGMRGFGARSAFGVRGVQLFVDGIPATMPDGQGQLSHVPLGALQRVDVLRGPFSALYGNAAGGVLEFWSRDPPARPAFGIRAGGGTDDGARASLWWGAPWDGDGSGGYRLDGEHYDTAGYRTHGRARRDVAQARLLWDGADGTRVALTANGLDLVAQDPQGLTLAQAQATPRAASAGALAFDTRKRVRQQQLGLRVEHPLGDGDAWTVSVWTGHRATFQMLSVPVAAQAAPGSGGGAVDLDRDYGGVDARWRHRLADGARPLDLTVGAQWQRSSEHRRGYENFAGGRLGVVGALRRDEQDGVDDHDLYAEVRWRFAPRWNATLGVRRSVVAFHSDDAYVAPGNPDDSGRLHYARTTPVFGLLYAPDDGMELFANAGRGFETPTFSELAYRNDGGSGLNTTLRPARSRSAELGLRAHRGGHALEFVAFASRTDDELVVASSIGGRSTYANATRSARDGWELSVDGPLAPRWRYAVALTRLDARYTRAFATCRAPPCAAPDTPIAAGSHIPATADAAWAELRWSPDGDVDVFLQGDATARLYADDANTEWAPGHATLDLGVERHWRVGGRRLTAFVRIDNLLDRRAIGSVIVDEANGRYFEPAPGRGGWIGLALEPAHP